MWNHWSDKTLKFICLNILFITNTSLAAITSPYINLNIASAYKSKAPTQRLNLLGNLGNTYVANSGFENKLAAVIGVGANIYQQQKFKLNAGINYIPIVDLSQSGVIWQLHSPRFANSNYSYRVSSNLLLAEGELFATHFILQPSFIFGLGPALNRVNSYQEYPRNPLSSIQNNKFGSASNTQFSYEFGGGLNYPVSNAIFSLAYRYINAGSISFEPFGGQQTTARFSAGQLEYHILSLGVKLQHDKPN